MSVGTEGVELDFAGREVGRPEGVTDREAGILDRFGVGAGRCEPAAPTAEVRRDGLSGGSVGVVRDLATGNAGRGPVGGANGGRDERGSVEVMVVYVDVVVADVAVISGRSVNVRTKR